MEKGNWMLRIRAAAWVVLMMCVLGLPQPALAEAVVNLTPDRGRVGTDVRVTGEGFSPGAAITLLWDDLLLTDLLVADEGGSFAASFRVPPSSNGPHSVVARSVGARASARFIVQGDTEATTTTTTTTPATTTTTTAPTTTTTTARTTTTAGPTTTPTTTATTSSPTTSPSAAPSTDAPRTTRGGGTTPTSVPSGDPDPGPSTTGPSEEQSSSSTNPERWRSTGSENGTGRTVAPSVADTTVVEPAETDESRTDAPYRYRSRLRVDEFSIEPDAAPSNATVDLQVEFKEAVEGPRLQFRIDDIVMGDPVRLDGSHVSVQRSVPELPPGSYVVTASAADVVLAETDFTILEPNAASSGPHPVIGLVLVGMGAGLGWQGMRRLEVAIPSPSGLGALDAFYSWISRWLHRQTS